MFVCKLYVIQYAKKHTKIHCEVSRAVSWTFHGQRNITNYKSKINLCYFPQLETVTDHVAFCETSCVI